MIPADAHLEVAWLDTADLVPDPPQPLDWAKVGYYIRLMSSPPAQADVTDPEWHLAPVVVNQRDQLGRYSFRDGRHRWAAHVALGRARIRAVVVTLPIRAGSA